MAKNEKTKVECPKRYFIGIEGRDEGNGLIAFDAIQYVNLVRYLSEHTRHVQGVTIRLMNDVEDSYFKRRGHNDSEEFYHEI